MRAAAPLRFADRLNPHRISRVRQDSGTGSLSATSVGVLAEHDRLLAGLDESMREQVWIKSPLSWTYGFPLHLSSKPPSVGA